VIPIGDILKKLRAQKKLSLRALGEDIGISFNTLAAYERNLVQPTIENCYKLSRYFEVPMEYFILGEKANKEFRDPELLVLFHGADGLQRPDRNVIKGYVRKYLKAKQVLDDLALQAEEEDQKEEKKRPKKRKKSSK
jgi:transcriptional regulator with XRE-family HTH domain